MESEIIKAGYELVQQNPMIAIGTSTLLIAMIGYRLTNDAVFQARKDAKEEGLGGEKRGAEVHHIIPIQVAKDQDIDPDLITSRFNALAIPKWIHKKLHQRFSNEELASLGYEGTLEEARKIKNER